MFSLNGIYLYWIIGEYIPLIILSLSHYCDRVPEVVFLGADVVMKMEEDELEEIGWTMIVFFFSIFLQRCAHGIMEVFLTLSLSLLIIDNILDSVYLQVWLDSW